MDLARDGMTSKNMMDLFAPLSGLKERPTFTVVNVGVDVFFSLVLFSNGYTYIPNLFTSI